MSEKIAHIKVLKPGISSVQDLGRFGYLSEGIPRAGFMDETAAGLANALVGNTPDVALIEWTTLPPKLQFTDSAIIALTGVTATVFINDRKVQLHKRLLVPKNGILSFKQITKGVYGYIAVKHGVKTTEVLGSRSWFLNITTNVLFKKNMQVPFISTLNKVESNVKLKASFKDSDTIILKAFKGPEFNLLSAVQKDLLLNSIFKPSIHKNRMGVQIEPEFEKHTNSILSAPTIPGTVQWTPSGKLIVLMKNGQTIGGYPRLLQLTESSIIDFSQITGSFLFKIID